MLFISCKKMGLRPHFWWRKRLVAKGEDMQRLLVRYVLSATLIIIGWSTVGHTHDISSSQPPVLAASG